MLPWNPGIIFKRGVNFLLENGIDIEVMTMDRSPLILKTIRVNYPHIHDKFDIWHVVKGMYILHYKFFMFFFICITCIFHNKSLLRYRFVVLWLDIEDNYTTRSPLLCLTEACACGCCCVGASSISLSSSSVYYSSNKYGWVKKFKFSSLSKSSDMFTMTVLCTTLYNVRLSQTVY